MDSRSQHQDIGREEREENPENKSLAQCRLASSMYSPRVLGGKKEFAALKMKNDAPAPIGASIDARGNASRWAQNFAGTRLATSFQRLGARGNGALALRKSAISRQFDRLGAAAEVNIHLFIIYFCIKKGGAVPLSMGSFAHTLGALGQFEPRPI
jgi:hypothetical protein